ncbi:MAG TPA: hypothetical protein PK413_19200 [Thermoanaerobaculia bacterium]|nr:hypothetical protein [Thermoanaerobaculia bacterium]
MPDPILISAQAARDIPGLRALLVIAMPDCLLYDSWSARNEDWRAEDVASYLGDLVRANRETLKALRAWSSEMQLTIEAGEILVVLKELGPDFVCGAIFALGTPLGMARLHLRRLLDRLEQQLPRYEVEKRPPAVRVLEFLKRYAPDPHAVLLRVSLRTGILHDRLLSPEALSDDETQQVEDAAKSILGLAQLNL